MGDIPLSMIIVLIILIFLSAFFSSSETAFSSVNRIRLKNYADEGRRGSKKALYVTERFDTALSTILVGNNIVNIAATSIATSLATELFPGGLGIFLSTVVMTIVVLIFGEVLPKSIAKEKAEEFSLSIAGIMVVLMKLFTPITILFVWLKKIVFRLISTGESTPSVTEEEIKTMVDISEEEGVIDNNEKELVHRSLDFNDIIVGEVLQPRTDIIAVEVNQPVNEILEVFLKERYSRIPVYEDNIDNIIGILSEREFLSNMVVNRDANIRELMRDPFFVVESMKIATLLPELQKSKTHMSIVVDEFGGTSGLITLEDIIEELVGEIWDEHDEKFETVTQISDNTYVFNADAPLDEFLGIIGQQEPNSDYHTVGGWIFEKLERIPIEGEHVQYENIEITILKVENRRIRSVEITVHPLETEE